MYLIRVELDRADPRVRSMLADCQKLHGFVTGLFSSAREENHILYRLKAEQGPVRLYLYADSPVTGPALSSYPIVQREITPWVDSLGNGKILQFDLLASPSKKVAAEGKKNSQRRVLRLPEERQAWMEQKARQNGYTLLSFTELGQQHSTGRHGEEEGGTMFLDAYQYQGVLQITDAELFHKALRNGIGSGRAYGFGMLLLKQG